MRRVSEQEREGSGVWQWRRSVDWTRRQGYVIIIVVGVRKA